MKKLIKIEIQKADGMQEGFAAYRVSPAISKERVVLLNVYATLLSSLENELDPKELILENLMHEFGHAMQEFLDLEFSEEIIEKIIKSYCDKYHEKGYEEVHGKQPMLKHK